MDKLIGRIDQTHDNSSKMFDDKELDGLVKGYDKLNE